MVKTMALFCGIWQESFSGFIVSHGAGFASFTGILYNHGPDAPVRSGVLLVSHTAVFRFPQATLAAWLRRKGHPMVTFPRSELTPIDNRI